MDEKLCILSPVWPSYRAFAFLLAECLERFWPGHPELFFAAPSAWNLPANSLDPGEDPHQGTNWSWTLLQAVRQARAKGYRQCYLLAEEHLPLSLCNKYHLEVTIPSQAKELGAKYVSLMGWDNKRYSFRSTVLSKSQFRWMHLTGRRDPRFHLHPAWWDLETLEACCELALENSDANGSAWHFEKVCDLAGDRLPSCDCYQICAGAMCSRPTPLWSSLAERWFFNKLMAIVPRLPVAWRRPYYDACGFDMVYCDGPYPIVFSGALAKGKINPALLKFRKTVPDDIMKTIHDLVEP
jgi:hypothetical protein